MEWLIFGGIMIIIIFLVIWSSVGLAESSSIYYKEMEEVKILAKKATTEKELNIAWTAMYNIYKEKAFHRTHSDIMIEVRTILTTKYEILDKNGNI